MVSFPPFLWQRLINSVSEIKMSFGIRYWHDKWSGTFRWLRNNYGWVHEYALLPCLGGGRQQRRIYLGNLSCIMVKVMISRAGVTTRPQNCMLLAILCGLREFRAGDEHRLVAFVKKWGTVEGRASCGFPRSLSASLLNTTEKEVAALPPDSVCEEGSIICLFKISPRPGHQLWNPGLFLEEEGQGNWVLVASTKAWVKI